jgi:hypothetical protein
MDGPRPEPLPRYTVTAAAAETVIGLAKEVPEGRVRERSAWREAVCVRGKAGGRIRMDGMGWDRSAIPYSKAVLPGFNVHLQPVGDLAEQARDHPDRLHGRERDLYIEGPLYAGCGGCTISSGCSESVPSRRAHWSDGGRAIPIGTMRSRLASFRRSSRGYRRTT